MDILKLLADLRAYRSELEEAIRAFSNLARKRGQLRGRPPGSGSKKKGMKRSAEARQRMSQAQKKRWASERKARKRPRAPRAIR